MGVGSVRFLWQALLGQLEILNRTQKIEEVLKDHRISALEKFYLSHVAEIKKFGESYLLKPTSNYSDYVKLNREAVVWVVTASNSLKFEPRIWSFPTVGSFNYIGFFEKNLALEKGKILESEGLDVYVRGASAFSTLGWMNDPILSTMFDLVESKKGENLGELINTVIHESVHATYYVPDQSYFNESLASFVADELTEVFFKQKILSGSEDWKNYYQAYQAGMKYWQERKLIYHELYSKLEIIYSENISELEKQEKKHLIIEEHKRKYTLKGTINNAQLIQFKTYNAQEQYFLNVFKTDCSRDWKCFWEKIKQYSFNKPQLESL